jgi:hypothetical protein
VLPVTLVTAAVCGDSISFLNPTFSTVRFSPTVVLRWFELWIRTSWSVIEAYFSLCLTSNLPHIGESTTTGFSLLAVLACACRRSIDSIGVEFLFLSHIWSCREANVGTWSHPTATGVSRVSNRCGHPSGFISERPLDCNANSTHVPSSTISFPQSHAVTRSASGRYPRRWIIDRHTHRARNDG